MGLLYLYKVHYFLHYRTLFRATRMKSNLLLAYLKFFVTYSCLPPVFSSVPFLQFFFPIKVFVRIFHMFAILCPSLFTKVLFLPTYLGKRNYGMKNSHVSSHNYDYVS